MTTTYKITSKNKFYTENYINSRCAITAAGADQTACLYDNVAETSATFTVATSSVFNVAFYDRYGSANILRTIDTIVIQGVTGATKVDATYINASDAEVTLLTQQALTADNLIVLPTAISAKALKLTFTAPGATFTIKQIRALCSILELLATSKARLTENSDKGNLTTKDGTYYAWTKYQRDAISLDVDNGSYTQYKTLKAKEKASEFITIFPFYDLEFFCFEGALKIGDAEISRWSSLVNYKMEITAK